MCSFGVQQGQLFKPYQDIPLPLQNHCKLAMNAVGHLLLIICINNIIHYELEQVSTMPINIRVFEHATGYILPVFRIGKTDLIFEAPFDPTVYTKERLSLMQSKEGITMVMVEGTKNIIVCSRILDFPEALYKKLKSHWLAAFQRKEPFTVSYTGWIKSVQSTLKMKDLWRFAGEERELEIS